MGRLVVVLVYVYSVDKKEGNVALILMIVLKEGK